jgi:hypothetical protein
MEETEKKGVYKILFKKIKQLYGIKVGDETIKKQGTSWQCFLPCNLAGLVTENRHHYCCVHCGYYIRGVDPKNTAGLEKLKGWTKHPRVCRGDNESVDDDGENLNSVERLPATEKEIMPFVVDRLVRFVCVSRISLVKAVSKEFTKLIYGCMDLAKKFKDLPLDRIFPEWSRTTLSRKINEYGEKKAEKNLKIFVGRHVCIIWDAGKGLISLFVLFSFEVL